MDFTDLERAQLGVRHALLTATKAASGALFPLDFLAWAAANRSASLSHAFRLLLENRNFWSAVALLRMQMDTVLRFKAAWHVKDPHQLAERVLKGERLSELRDRNGHKLTDRHLVRLTKDEAPWIERVYDETSGYVHMSATHMFASGESVTEDGSIALKVSAEDPARLSDESRQEAIDCFTQLTEMLGRYLHGWAETKDGKHLAKPDA